MRCWLLALVLTAACDKGTAPPPASTGSPNAQTETGPRARPPGMLGASGPGTTAPPTGDRARQMFSTVCATCHGMSGRGDGPASENLNPKPRDYTDAKWQASVSDDDLRKTILLGGQATGKSAMMPGQPQLKDDPQTLDGLVRIIRGFAQR
jgi:cytochrome c553